MFCCILLTQIEGVADGDTLYEVHGQLSPSVPSGVKAAMECGVQTKTLAAGDIATVNGLNRTQIPIPSGTKYLPVSRYIYKHRYASR